MFQAFACMLGNWGITAVDNTPPVPISGTLVDAVGDNLVDNFIRGSASGTNRTLEIASNGGVQMLAVFGLVYRRRYRGTVISISIPVRPQQAASIRWTDLSGQEQMQWSLPADKHTVPHRQNLASYPKYICLECRPKAE